MFYVDHEIQRLVGRFLDQRDQKLRLEIATQYATMGHKEAACEIMHKLVCETNKKKTERF